MPSKTSKRKQKRPSLWKAAHGCSEAELETHARALAPLLQPGSRVVLEGPMGAGKTTFARTLLRALGVRQPPEGSPTFAIAHEYDSPKGGVVHIDLYRLEHESEIEDAGIEAYFWERPLIVIVEWLSRFPAFEQAVLDPARNVSQGSSIWRVEIAFAENPELRDLGIYRLS